MSHIIKIYNPLEQFEIIKFVAMEGPLFGYIQIGLTNIVFYLLVVLALILCLMILTSMAEGVGRRNAWALAQEALFGFVHNLVNSQLGAARSVFFSCDLQLVPIYPIY